MTSGNVSGSGVSSSRQSLERWMSGRHSSGKAPSAQATARGLLGNPPTRRVKCARHIVSTAKVW